MAVSKSIRFEVFARDAFACQYCGRRPPEIVLELDHIHPRAKGGSDDLLNLLTACDECNRGKGAKVISEVAPRPDADLAFLRTQQEIAEAKRFLAAKENQDRLDTELCDSLGEMWTKYLTHDAVPNDRTLLNWISKYGPDEIVVAITSASPHYSMGQFDDGNELEALIKYVAAILRDRKNNKAAVELSAGDAVRNSDWMPELDGLPWRLASEIAREWHVTSCSVIAQLCVVIYEELLYVGRDCTVTDVDAFWDKIVAAWNSYRACVGQDKIHGCCMELIEFLQDGRWKSPSKWHLKKGVNVHKIVWQGASIYDLAEEQAKALNELERMG